MRAAEVYDRKHKIAGKRNGPLGAIGVDVLRELMRMIDFKTGRLEPAIATLAERLRRSRGAIVSALARLKDHGFLNWIRRFEPIEDPDAFGPQVKQVTNAYWFGLPKEAADMVRRMMGKGPLPDDEVTRRKADEEQTAAMLATVSAEDLAAFRAGNESPLAKALASLGRRVDLSNANSPGGQNPSLQG
ncbi:replication protein A [Sphingomonas aerolata]